MKFAMRCNSSMRFAMRYNVSHIEHAILKSSNLHNTNGERTKRESSYSFGINEGHFTLIIVAGLYVDMKQAYRA